VTEASIKEGILLTCEVAHITWKSLTIGRACPPGMRLVLVHGAGCTQLIVSSLARLFSARPWR